MSCELSAISQRRMLRNPPECLRLASVTHPSCDSSKTALSELDESSLPAFNSTSAGTQLFHCSKMTTVLAPFAMQRKDEHGGLLRKLNAKGRARILQFLVVNLPRKQPASHSGKEGSADNWSRPQLSARDQTQRAVFPRARRAATACQLLNLLAIAAMGASDPLPSKLRRAGYPNMRRSSLFAASSLSFRWVLKFLPARLM